MPKLAQPLRQYSPDPIPRDGNNPLTTYMESELRKVAEALRPLTISYTPNVVVQLTGPTTPTQVGAAAQVVANYTGQIISNEALALGIDIDPVAGTLQLRGVGDQYVTLMFWCGFSIDVSGYPQNESIELYLSTQDERRLIGSYWKADNKQDEMSMGGTYGIVVRNDRLIQIEVEGSDTGSIVWDTGAFGLSLSVGNQVLETP